MPGAADELKFRRAACAAEAIKILLLIVTAVWQVYTMGRLGAFGHHLVETRDRHEELQRSLNDAQAALQNLHNASRSCEHTAQDHAAQLEAAARERKTLEFKVEELSELHELTVNSTYCVRMNNHPAPRC